MRITKVLTNGDDLFKVTAWHELSDKSPITHLKIECSNKKYSKEFKYTGVPSTIDKIEQLIDVTINEIKRIKK